MDRGGTQVDEQTIGLKDAMSFEEGMDHALVGHSSEHPGENYNVERLTRLGDSLRLAHFIADFFGESPRQVLACLLDKPGIRIVRAYDGSELRQPPRERKAA